MDRKTGRELSGLFQEQVARYTPHVLNKAVISFANENQSRITVECDTPFEAAQWLEDIMSSDKPHYQRLMLNANMVEPVTFAMDARYFEEPDQRERVKAGIILRFVDMNTESELHLHGQLTQGGPTAKELINTLKRAGEKWGQINFVPDAKKAPPHLRVVR